MIGPQLADENLIESFRMHARWQSPVEVEDSTGVLLIAGSTPRPGLYRNCAIRLDPSEAPGLAFEQAMSYFGARERGFMLLTRKRLDQDLERLLEDAGLSSVARSPCMILNQPVPEPEAPDGVELLPVDSPQRLADSVAVNCEAYPMLGLPAEEIRAFFRHGERVMKDQVGGFVAYRQGVPLATALTYHTGDSAGIYWVGTTRSAQRQGLAEACTRLAANACFHRGAKLVTLQASPYGFPIYDRLGFKCYDRLSFYYFDRSQVS